MPYIAFPTSALTKLDALDTMQEELLTLKCLLNVNVSYAHGVGNKVHRSVLLPSSLMDNMTPVEHNGYYGLCDFQRDAPAYVCGMSSKVAQLLNLPLDACSDADEMMKNFHTAAEHARIRCEVFSHVSAMPSGQTTHADVEFVLPEGKQVIRLTIRKTRTVAVVVFHVHENDIL